MNAVDYTDLKVFATCFARARAIGKRFICRSAASLPKVLGNISDRPLLMRTDVVDASHNAHGTALRSEIEFNKVRTRITVYEDSIKQIAESCAKDCGCGLRLTRKEVLDMRLSVSRAGSTRA